MASGSRLMPAIDGQHWSYVTAPSSPAPAIHAPDELSTYLASVQIEESYRDLRAFIVEARLPDEWKNRTPSSDLEWEQYNALASFAGRQAQPILDKIMQLELAYWTGSSYHQPNYASPLQRFLVVNTSASPHPWMAKQLLEELEYEYGLAVLDYQSPMALATSSVAATFESPLAVTRIPNPSTTSITPIEVDSDESANAVSSLPSRSGQQSVIYPRVRHSSRRLKAKDPK